MENSKNMKSQGNSNSENINSEDTKPESFEPVRLAEFEAVISAYEKILILTHDNPDPDAIGSAFGLYKLISEKYGKDVRIGHGGIIGRTENKLMIKKLSIPIYSMQLIADSSIFDGVILVDTQPDAHYHTLPEPVEIIAVFDHHPLISTAKVNYFQELRSNIGSSSTIVTHYLDAADFEISEALATSLFYGIKTDTLDFSRHTSKWDIDAHQILFPIMSSDILVQIEKPALPREYYIDLGKALENAMVYDNTTIVDMEHMLNPDMAPLVADLMLQYENVNWVIVMGYFENELRLAVRCNTLDGHAGKLVKKIVKNKGNGGGHQGMAAAQIKLNLFEKEVEFTVLRDMIFEMIRKELKLPEHGIKLCRDKKHPPPHPGSTGKLLR
ncbi:MAG: DHH family phosphoesterase [Planctomycetes bacterium]|nr:DHH family phosphoesterase [Planctomycetota bacterium]